MLTIDANKAESLIAVACSVATHIQFDSKFTSLILIEGYKKLIESSILSQYC